MAKARAHVYFRGRVQGVFFRAFTREVAADAGLAGWVRNLEDGRVEAIFEGEKTAVENAIRRCTQGPPGSKVTAADTSWEPFNGEFSGFEVKYR